MVRYITVAKETDASLIIERSRFIAYVKPVKSREEADEFLASIRKKHRDATHNVPAFVIGENQELQWASDDGEPSGTSGAPILQMVVKEGITNVAVVVTRYFGGIKLGTGGLVRAYTSVAKLALDDAGKFAVKDYTNRRFRLSYSDLNEIKNLASVLDYEIINIIYDDKVSINIRFESERETEIINKLYDFSQGRIIFLD